MSVGIAVWCLIGLASGLVLGWELRGVVAGREILEWDRMLWLERHRAAWLEAETAELRAELTRLKLAMSERMEREEAGS